MDNANIYTGNDPDENHIHDDPAREQCGAKRGGEQSPSAMSPPNNRPDPKRNRLNLSPINSNVNKTLLSEENSASQTRHSQASEKHLPSDLQHGLSLCTCGHEGHLANHLREASQCLEDLRQLEELEFMRNAIDPAFIAKVALILSGCPAPECPGGDHKNKPLPEQCLQWFREEGGELMGFKGSSTASNKQMKKKINDFLQKTRLRHPQTHSLTQGTPVQQSQADIDTTQSAQNRRGCANYCSFEGSLAGHLLQQPGCLTAMVRQHLPSRAALYQGKPRLAVFDLSALLYFCLNPDCTFEATGRHRHKDISDHIRGPCLNFFQNQGQDLLDWQPGLEADSVCAKLLNRRCHVMRTIQNNAEEVRLETYEEECNAMLAKKCRRCGIRGPLSGHKEHDMVVVGGTVNEIQYECTACHNQEERHLEMLENVWTPLQDLSLAKPHNTKALVAAVVQHPLTHQKRIVFVPAHLSGDLQVVECDVSQIPHASTVMVPKHPAALDQILETMFDVAADEKEALREFAGFLARRRIVGNSALELSVFWRMMLANIKVERKAMLTALCNTRKGKIEARRPERIASIKDRNANYTMTKEFCLTNTVPWSERALEKQSSEQEARSAVNGVVKTKVMVTLHEEVAANFASAHFCLNRAYGKLKALVRY